MFLFAEGNLYFLDVCQNVLININERVYFRLAKDDDDAVKKMC